MRWSRSQRVDVSGLVDAMLSVKKDCARAAQKSCTEETEANALAIAALRLTEAAAALTALLREEYRRMALGETRVVK